MQKILSLLILFVLCSCASKQEYINKLTMLDRQSDKMIVLQEAINSSGSNRIAALDWLKVKVKNDGDPRYAYTYAILLDKVGVKDSPASILLAAMLTSRVDAARCADKSAPSSKIAQWENGNIFKNILKNYKNLPHERKDQIITTAIAVENASSPYRKPNEWLCSGGMSAISKSLNSEKPSIKEIDSVKDIGKTFSIDTSNVKTEFVTHYKWMSERRKIIKKFVEQMEEL